MNKIMIRLILIGVLGVFISLSAAAAATMEFAATYQDPDTSNISKFYQKTSADALNRAGAEALAASLLSYTGCTLTVDEDASDETQLVYTSDSDGTAMLTISYLTGNFHFCKGIESYFTQEETPDLPPDESAPTYAENHLGALNLYNLYSDVGSSTIQLFHVGGVNIAIKPESSEIVDDFRKWLTVSYTRNIHSLPVVGASRNVVGIGSNGELLQLVWDWPEVEEHNLDPGEIMNSTEIRDRITAILQDEYPDADSIVVDTNELVMYNDDYGTIEPALAVFGRVTMPGEAEAQDIDWIVPIVRNPLGIYLYMADLPPEPGQSDENNPPPSGDDE